MPIMQREAGIYWRRHPQLGWVPSWIAGTASGLEWADIETPKGHWGRYLGIEGWGPRIDKDLQDVGYAYVKGVMEQEQKDGYPVGAWLPDIMAKHAEEAAHREATQADRIKKMVNDSLTLHELSYAAGQPLDVTVGVPHWLTKAIAESLAITLGDAPNYVEMDAVKPATATMTPGVAGDGNRFSITVQRLSHGAKTPHTLRKEAEAKVLDLETQLRQAHASLDMLASRAMQAGARETAAKELLRDWLTTPYFDSEEKWTAHMLAFRPKVLHFLGLTEAP